ncbi:hypothetical protein HBI18_253480 [Parastagonospora nodorum]|nr:hypothetical protein HBI18_253480 [Parastagonospora nodorum]
MEYSVRALAGFAILFITSVTGFVHRINRVRQRKTNEALGRHHGCLPAPRLPNQRPWGIDRLVFRADAESRLMELFLFHFRQTGKTLEQRLLGTKAYGTIEPANFEAILSTQSAGNLELHHNQYGDLAIFKPAVDDLIGRLLAVKGVVDLQPLFLRLTEDSAKERGFAKAFNTAQRWVAKRFRLLDFYWIIDGREFRKACEEVHDFAEQLIDRNLSLGKREEGSLKKNSFLDAVTKSTSDRTVFRGQIINLIAGGRDTTACLLSWTIFLLIRHPRAMEKLRAEIAAASVACSTITRDTLKNISYLQNVLRESGLHCSINTRIASRNTALPVGGGLDGKSPVLIPKGSSVAFSIYSMHRQAESFGMNAELFCPERWEKHMPLHDNPVRAKRSYLPFHGGPRSCPGRDFAMAEAGYTVVRLLQRFPAIQLAPGERVALVGREKQDTTFFLSIRDGCNVRLGEGI